MVLRSCETIGDDGSPAMNHDAITTPPAGPPGFLLLRPTPANRMHCRRGQEVQEVSGPLHWHQYFRISYRLQLKLSYRDTVTTQFTASPAFKIE